MTPRPAAARTLARPARNCSTARRRWMTRVRRSSISTASTDRIVHYCVDNDIPYESSLPLDQFKDAQGNLDDVKLIKAFNDDKAPLVFTPKAPIPAGCRDGFRLGPRSTHQPGQRETASCACRKGPRRVRGSGESIGCAVHGAGGLGISRRAARECADAEYGAGPALNGCKVRDKGDSFDTESPVRNCRSCQNQ